MSELADRMKQLDAQRKHIIAEAMEKKKKEQNAKMNSDDQQGDEVISSEQQQSVESISDDQQGDALVGSSTQKDIPENAGKDRSLDLNRSRMKNDGKSFPKALIALVFLIFITMAVVFVFSIRTIGKVSVVSNFGEQLAVLLEEQYAEFLRLQIKVDAIELEFRRAFKKDRNQMALIQKDLIKKDVELDDQMKAFSKEITVGVLKYKTVVMNNDARVNKIEREYDDLIKRFDNVRTELVALRRKVVGLTATPVVE